MECAICKLQYLGKNETPFKIRLNNHKKDVKDPKAILPDKHFQKKTKKTGHRFNEPVRFTMIDRLTNTNLDKEILTERLTQRGNFWIQKLKTLYPKVLNKELNM